MPSLTTGYLALVLGAGAAAALGVCPAANIDPSCSTASPFEYHDSEGRTFNCGTMGYLKHPSLLNDACTTPDLATCRDDCLSKPACISFSYAAGNNTCSLYSTSLPRMTYRSKTMDLGATFSNRGCFTQTCCSSTPTTPDNCDGTCVNTDTDEKNCGTCGTTCGDDERCETGTCTAVPPTCNSPEALCSGTAGCVDLTSDPDNCGSCGNSCTTNTCVNGACTTPSQTQPSTPGSTDAPTTQSCAAATCKNFIACAALSSNCACASTADNQGFCVDGDVSCASLKDCTTNADCDIGHVCGTGNCCGTGKCVNASTTCQNAAGAKFLFRKRASGPTYASAEGVPVAQLKAKKASGGGS